MRWGLLMAAVVGGRAGGVERGGRVVDGPLPVPVADLLDTAAQVVGCVASLRAHRERQAGEWDRTGADWQGSRYVFTRPDGRPIEPATLTRHFNTLLRDAHLRPIRLHDLCHSTATLLLEQGVELVVIKDLLGHAHIGVTAMVYAHVRLRLQRQAIDLLGHTLGSLAKPTAAPDDGDNPSPRAAPVR